MGQGIPKTGPTRFLFTKKKKHVQDASSGSQSRQTTCLLRVYDIQTTGGNFDVVTPPFDNSSSYVDSHRFDSFSNFADGESAANDVFSQDRNGNSGFVGSNGPILSPLVEMELEEGFALREWRRYLFSVYLCTYIRTTAVAQFVFIEALVEGIGLLIPAHIELILSI